MKNRMKNTLILLTAMLVLLLTGCEDSKTLNLPPQQTSEQEQSVYTASANADTIAEVLEYSGEPYVTINDNVPEFTADEEEPESYEEYDSLDSLGRCTAVEACIGQDLMPTEKRGKIGQIKPTGWHTVKYDNVDGKFLYNRCHLIGYQLTAENANEKNLITGTRYMNVQGMLPFENMVADYIKETKNHVLYRVTPIFEGDNPVASGVQMEAESVEDEGESISYNVFVYNVQPGITIDYETGESWLSEDGDETKSNEKETESKADAQENYILNTSSRKFHYSSCSGVASMKAQNKEEYIGSRTDLTAQGYEPCGNCKP